jgi:hypothetical protein
MLTVADIMKMKEQKDLNGLLRALRDQDIAVRAEAVSSLGGIGDRGAVEPLISTLQDDSDPYVRSLAATALGQLGDPRARDALVKCIANDTMDVIMAASKAQFMLEANIVRGREVAQEKPAAKATESKGEGCAASFWGLTAVYLVILWIGTEFMLLVGVVSAIEDAQRFWPLEVGIFLALLIGVWPGFRALVRFVWRRYRKAKGLPEKEDPKRSAAQSATKSAAPQGSMPAKDSGKQEQAPRLGLAERFLVWVANEKAVAAFRSAAEVSGLSLEEAVSAAMGGSGLRSELAGAGDKVWLSDARVAWCAATFIYLDKRGGGVYVLSTQVPNGDYGQAQLEYQGTVDAKVYAQALCHAHGIDARNLL